MDTLRGLRTEGYVLLEGSGGPRMGNWGPRNVAHHARVEETLGQGDFCFPSGSRKGVKLWKYVVVAGMEAMPGRCMCVRYEARRVWA